MRRMGKDRVGERGGGLKICLVCGDISTGGSHWAELSFHCSYFLSFNMSLLLPSFEVFSLMSGGYLF